MNPLERMAYAAKRILWRARRRQYRAGQSVTGPRVLVRMDAGIGNAVEATPLGDDIDLEIYYHVPERSPTPMLVGFQRDIEREFFRKLVCHFARALQVPCAFITECADYPTTRLRTLAFWSDGNYVDDFEYDLPGTPCETVVKDGQTCFYRKGVADLFPVEAGYEGYLGIPIFASDKRVIGHLVFLDTREMGDDMLIDSVYRIFTARAAAEMERLMALNLLHQQTSAASLEAN